MIDLFLMSKPVHLLHILNIRKNSKLSTSILIIVHNFNNADNFFKLVNELDLFSEVFLVNHEEEIPIIVSGFDINNIYYNWDHGPDIEPLLGIEHKNYYLFDDGFFSYVDNFEKGNLITSTLRRLYRFIKSEKKLRLGYSNNTKGIYLYYPKSFSFYHKNYPNEIHAMPLCFIDAMCEFKGVFNAIYKDNFSRKTSTYKKVGVYVTDKEGDFNDSVNDIIRCHDVEILFVKLHPHIKGKSIEARAGVELLSSSLPVEFILVSILNKCEKLVVFHHNSSAGFHMEGYKNIEIINLGRDYLLTKKFNRLTHFIKGEMLEK